MKINWYKVTYLSLLAIIVILLINVNIKVKEHYEAFDENPLLFGADKYEINECTCSAKKGNFKFNQEKIWQERIGNEYVPVNISGLDKLLQ